MHNGMVELKFMLQWYLTGFVVYDDARYQSREKGVGTERAKKKVKEATTSIRQLTTKLTLNIIVFFHTFICYVSDRWLWFLPSIHHPPRNSVPDLLLMFFSSVYSNRFDSTLLLAISIPIMVIFLLQQIVDGMNTKNNGSTTCDFQLTRWNFAHTFLLFLSSLYIGTGWNLSLT